MSNPWRSPETWDTGAPSPELCCCCRRHRYSYLSFSERFDFSKGSAAAAWHFTCGCLVEERDFDLKDVTFWNIWKKTNIIFNNFSTCGWHIPTDDSGNAVPSAQFDVIWYIEANINNQQCISSEAATGSSLFQSQSISIVLVQPVYGRPKLPKIKNK